LRARQELAFGGGWGGRDEAGVSSALVAVTLLLDQAGYRDGQPARTMDLFPISFREAKALGLNISSSMPESVMKLLGQDPQPVRRQPGVEYSPGERRSKRTEG
jgi:hypothetical protein